MKKLFAILAVIALSVTCAACSQAQDDTQSSNTEQENQQSEEQKDTVAAFHETSGENDPNKKALLVVSFGTSYNDNRENTIGAIENDMVQAFPDYDVKRAFTSQTIIDKLEERDNLKINNISEAMEELKKDGYGTVVCQPTHVMNGYEYDDVVAEVSKYESSFDTLKIGKPLLTAAEDYDNLADALVSSMPEIGEKEAIVFMGHGTTHSADSAYAALAYHIQAKGMDNYFVGTVEGFPDFETILKQLNTLSPEKVYLAPLMVVAGDHANNDLAGDGEDSWKTLLKLEGYEVEPILKGMGEYPAVRQLYLNHAKQAIESQPETEE